MNNIVLLLTPFSNVAAFRPSDLQAKRPSSAQTSLHVTHSQSRRSLLKHLPILIPITTTSPSFANAESDLFKPNPLANPVLEKIRIWEQDEADNIIYKGELASGSNGPAAFDQYVQLLQPILIVEGDILKLNELFKSGTDLDTLRQMKDVLEQPNLDKKAFKKAFNAFADNIYYVDTDRANAYLGGGATPGSTQSMAYLLRNDVLTSIEDMRAEVGYLIRELEKGEKIGEGGVDALDLEGMLKMAKEGMGRYLDLVPPKELEAARTKFG